LKHDLTAEVAKDFAEDAKVFAKEKRIDSYLCDLCGYIPTISALNSY